MVQYAQHQLREDLNHVIQWAAVAKQTLAVEAGAAGAVALRAAVEELTREQEHVLKSLHTMVLHVHHIKIQTLEVVIHRDAVVRQLQVVDHTEAVVKNVVAELRRELVQENHLIMALHVLHIPIQQVVIQWDVVVAPPKVVVKNVQRLKLTKRIVTKHLQQHVNTIRNIMASIVKLPQVHLKLQLQVGLRVIVKTTHL